jgi:uncharacterized protein (UPF0332 family)
LPQWLENGWLRKHQATRREIAELLGLTERDLADSRNADLSADWRLSIAYNAALQAATAALAAEGFRTSGGTPHHHYTIQSLAHTAKIDAERVQFLEDIRRKRNTVEYDRAGTVSDAEAQAAVEFASRLRDDVIEWLREKHPLLLQE